MKIKRAMVLAAGKGTRLGELTQKTPKPLVDLGGTTPLERVVKSLDEQGVEEVVINCHWLGEQIVQQVKLWKDKGLFKAKLILSYEEELLETAGGIKKALHHFKEEPFYVVNADIVWPNQNLNDFLKILEENYNLNCDFLMGFTPVKYSPNPNSSFVLKGDGKVYKKHDDEIAENTFGCISIAHPRAFDKVDEVFTGLRFAWEEALNKDALFGIYADLKWVDMGTPEGLEHAREIVKNIHE